MTRLPLGARFPGSSTPRRLLDRALLAVTVASCLALQLSGTIHLATVRHAICAEHGEAMDVGHDPHGSATTPAANGFEDGLYAGTDEAPAGEPHHHCPLDEDRNTHALVVHTATVGPRLAIPAEPVAPHAPLARLAPRALQLLAPKTSPPA